MEFRFPKLPTIGEAGSGRESRDFGPLTPKSVLSAISKSMEECRLDYPYSDPSLNGFSGYEIDTVSETLFPPMSLSESAVKKVSVVDSQFSDVNQGLGEVYARLSRLDLEQSTSPSCIYKMPKRAPKKPPRKPFDISSYAKKFMSSVAGVPQLQKSRTNVAKDLTLGGQLSDTSSEESTPLNSLKATSMPLSDLLLNSHLNKALPVPSPNFTEQGKILLPAMRTNGTKIRRGDPSFMHRIGAKTESLPTSLSFQTFRIIKEICPSFTSKSAPHFKNVSSRIRQNGEDSEKNSERNIKWAYLKLTQNSSISNPRICKSEALCDTTEHDYDVKDKSCEEREPEILHNQYFPKSVEKSYKTTEKNGKVNIVAVDDTLNEKISKMEISVDKQGIKQTTNRREVFHKMGEAARNVSRIPSKEAKRKFSNRRKIENARCRLPKIHMLGAAFDAKHEKPMSSSATEILPPIASNDLMISPWNLSAISIHNLRRTKEATDADDELEITTSFKHGRVKRHRRQPQCNFSGSETEDLDLRRAAKRRKKRKRTDVLSTVTIEGHKKRLAVKKTRLKKIKPDEDQSRIGAGDKTTAIRLPSPISSSDQDMRNTTSERIISRYINDLTKQGHTATSDPGDGDDELEEDDHKFSDISMT